MQPQLAINSTSRFAFRRAAAPKITLGTRPARPTCYSKKTGEEDLLCTDRHLCVQEEYNVPAKGLLRLRGIGYGQDKSVKNHYLFFPKTIRQEEYAALLRARVAEYDSPDVIVASGPAGTCKTLAATLVGVEKLMSGEVERLVLTRPAVSADEDLGHLPGSLEDKMHVWLLPILDSMRVGMKPHDVDRLFSSPAVEICSLSHMRGRTFRNSYVIVDECQNTTPSQMLMLMTRIGSGSRMVLTGDPFQQDITNRRDNSKSGLTDFLSRYEKIHRGTASDALLRVFEFDSGDVQRHRVIPHVLGLYEEQREQRDGSVVESTSENTCRELS